MIIQSLTGKWQFRQFDTKDFFPATVPGCAHTDLMVLGKIPDPFIGKNELEVQWIGDQDWEYVKDFDLDEQLMHSDRVFLVCKGLDTIAEINLNGQNLGKTDNMFRSYQWDVKPVIKSGRNHLSLLFHSPVKYIQAKQQQRQLPVGTFSGAAYIRKVQSHFGWDWGPTLPSSGIWGDIYLEGQSKAVISDVHLGQIHTKNNVLVKIEATVDQWQKGRFTLSVSLHHPDGHVMHINSAVDKALVTLDVRVDAPQLWWPNGLGEQPLYKIVLELFDGIEKLDSRTYQIGLRELELRQDPDEWGKTFTFAVNGVPIFAKGADWIPADSFITRLTNAQLEHLIRSCAQANMNMIRVWGGGFYESEDFYDLCDQYGILIWQDCGFACAAYPLDMPEFIENIKAELIENIHRLRHRASLAIWCGNNEIEMMLPMWKKEKSLTAAYEEFFHHTLPQLVNAEDPDHPYWPSSPSSNSFMVHTNGDAIGDTHLWHVWHGLRPFSYFQERYTRFCSEFGLESLPTLPTIASFAKESDYSLKSDVFLHHQRSVGGNDKMLYYLTTRFRIPANFSDMVYLTQIMQAECVRTGVEHWRRNRPRCSGALYWQLNDCWPVSSWASIDYCGRWKVLQYAARRFNASVALSIEEKSGQIVLHVANDSRDDFSGEVSYSLQTFDGGILKSGNQSITVPQNLSASWALPALTREIQRTGKKNVVLVAELHQNQTRLENQVHLFVPEKYLKLPSPDLTVEPRLEKDAVVFKVTAKKLALFVEIGLAEADVVFSDNFFDLPAGDTKEIRCPKPDGWALSQIEKALQMHSLVDVVPTGDLFTNLLEHYRTGLTQVSLKTRILFAFLE